MNSNPEAKPETAVARLLREIRECGSMTLHQVGALFPDERRTAVSYATVLNWVRDGVRAADGRLVWLESLQIGSRRITTAPAVERFLAARCELPTPEPADAALAVA